MNKYTLEIDGSKLRSLLESTTGKSLTEISLVNGFSKNFLNEACRVNKATNSVQAVAKLYGISPEDYKIKKVAPDKPLTQISIDDIETAKREELKALIKDVFNDIKPIKRNELKDLVREAVIEALRSFGYVRVSGLDYDPKSRRFKLFVNEEDLK